MEDYTNRVDAQYFDLVDLILQEGRVKHNRTGVDTIGIFGAQAKYDVDLNAFPILTTKKVFFKGIVHELLWFIKGNTNIKYLVDNDVHIWDEWAYKRYITHLEKHPEQTERHNPHGDLGGNRWKHFTQAEFIKEIKDDHNFALYWGELGEGTYGGMWRDFPHFKKTYEGPPERCGVGDEYEADGVDQIQKVIDKLKSNPDDRRMIVSAWHPYWVDHCALPPCHCLFHFNTEELTLEERDVLAHKRGMDTTTFEGCTDEYIHQVFDENNIPRRRLNCLLYQRSCDLGLGVPYNITSYCLLTAMIAQCVNMESGTFTHTYGDLHIYQNHMEQLKLQRTRTHKKLPTLWLNPEVKNLFDFKYDDIKLIDYDAHPTIKMDVAV